MAAKRTRKLVADKSSGRSFFDALPRNNTTAGSSSAAPLVISDGNPYNFVNSQSFDPDTQPSRRLHSNGNKALSTPDPVALSSSSSIATPSIFKLNKAKKSPRYLTEEERLQQKEDEELQRVLEASLREKEREDRMRRRNALKHKETQIKMLQKLKANIEEVDKARNLSEQSALPAKESEKSGEETQVKDGFSTPPLPSDGKRIHLSVKKLDIRCLTPKRSRCDNSTETSNSSQDEIDLAKSITQNADESDDATPPLSRKLSMKQFPLQTKNSNKTKEQRGAITSNVNLATVNELTSSLNVECSEVISLPFQVITLSPTNPLPPPTEPCPRPTEPCPRPTEPLPLPTEPCPRPTKPLPLPTEPLPPPTEPMDTTIVRRSNLSLSRNKRKRYNKSDKIVFEQMDNSSPLPPVKKMKVVEEEQPMDITPIQTVDEPVTIVTTGDIATISDTTMEHTLSVDTQTNCSVTTAPSLAAVQNICTPPMAVNKHCTGTPPLAPPVAPPLAVLTVDKQTSCSTTPILPTCAPSAAVTQERSASSNLCGLNPSLPPMYCPPGSSPSEYTPIIIQRLNSYLSQLQAAQRKVLTRLKWGEPVKMGSSQQFLFSSTRRRTRRSKDIKRDMRRALLVLPKRKRTSTADRKSFSLSGNSAEDRYLETNEVLSQQSPTSQMSSEKGSAEKSLSTDESSSVSSVHTSCSTAIYDDLIVLNTQGDVTTPLRGQGNVTTPLQGQGDVTTPLQGQGDVTTPLRGQGDVTTPLRGLGDVTTPLRGLGDVTTPLRGQSPTPELSPSASQHSPSSPPSHNSTLIRGSPPPHDNPPTLHDSSHDSPPTPYDSPLASRLHNSPPTLHNSPPTLHYSPPTLHNSPPTLHDSPPTLHDSPPTLHDSPPTLHYSPMETASQSESTKQEKTKKSPRISNKERTPTAWFNSRTKRLSNSKPIRTKKTKKSTPRLTVKRRTTRKPKSAAAKLMLGFVHKSESEDESSTVIEPARSVTPPARSVTPPARPVTPPARPVTPPRENTVSSEEEETEAKNASSGVIDLTEEDTRLSTHHTTPTHHTRRTRPTRRKEQVTTCPMCYKKFLPSVIGVHAAQCDGLESLPSIRTASKKGTKSTYQPTLHQLQLKEKEQQDDLIDSDSSASCILATSPSDNPLLDELSSALDGNLESHDSHVITPPTRIPRVIQTEDGGYRVDENTISNSPILTFTKLSDMDAKDSEKYKNQFNRPPPSKRRSNTVATGGGTWEGSDFGDLAHSSRGGSRRGRGHGKAAGGTGKKPKRFTFRGKGNKRKRKF